MLSDVLCQRDHKELARMRKPTFDNAQRVAETEPLLDADPRPMARGLH